MATAGNLITRENFPNAWGADTGKRNWDGNGYIYVCSASFTILVTTSYQSFWRSAHVTVYGWYYRWDTGQWVHRFTRDYVNGENNQSLRVFHNRTESTSQTYTYNDTAESRNYHLWKFRFNHHRGNSSNWGYYVWAGSAGVMNATEYANVAQGRLLKANGQVGSNLYWLIRSLDDAGAISRYNPNNNKGSLAQAAHKDYFIPNWE